MCKRDHFYNSFTGSLFSNMKYCIDNINIVAGISFVIGTIFFLSIPCISLSKDLSLNQTEDVLNLVGCLLYLIGTMCFLFTAVISIIKKIQMIPLRVMPWMKTDNSSEYNRMIQGESYTWKDNEIQLALNYPRALVEQFNTSEANNYEDRQIILERLFKHIGNGSFVEAPFKCDWGIHISIGNNTFINYNCVFNDYGKISIGDNVLIGFNVMLITSTHPTDPNKRLEKRNDGVKNINIGNNVWLGAQVIVLPGITIGDNSVIGAGSVVTKDVPPNVIAAGNPCRIIKKV